MTHDPANMNTRKKWPIFKRGLKQTCPNCAEAPLFKSYLKPVDNCAACGTAWKDVRADLAPSWAAMTIAAHIVVMIYHFFLFGSDMAQWLQTSIAMVLAIIICLAVLPPMKGLFMAIIWYHDTKDS